MSLRPTTVIRGLFVLVLFMPSLLCCNCFSFNYDNSITRKTTKTKQRHHQIQQFQQSTLLMPTKTPSTSSSSSSSSSSLRMGMGDVNDEYDNLEDRIKACIPYVLPILDHDIWGLYIHARFSNTLGAIDDVLLSPFIYDVWYDDYHVWRSLCLFVFFQIVGTPLPPFWQPPLKKNLRYNALQATYIDLFLTFPSYIIVGLIYENQVLPYSLVEPIDNFVYFTYISMILYCFYSNLIQGKRPTQIPFISIISDIRSGQF